MPVLGGRVLPALMIAAFASQAAAQAKACDLDEGTPSQVTRAVLDLQLAGSAGKPDVAATKLKEAVKFLNEGDMKRNPVGRASVYGKVMVTWLAQPSMTSAIRSRSRFGWRSSSLAIACAARSSARTWARLPPKLPIGVRTPSTRYTGFIGTRAKVSSQRLSPQI